jgi:hypothetical protein
MEVTLPVSISKLAQTAASDRSSSRRSGLLYSTLGGDIQRLSEE